MTPMPSCEAVERLVEADEEEHAHQSEIRKRIAIAEAEIDRGEFVEYDEHTLANLPLQVRERAMKRLATPGKSKAAVTKLRDSRREA